MLGRDNINLFPQQPRLGFFVVEAKGPSVVLDNHIPQVVGELFAAAKALKYVQPSFEVCSVLRL